MAALSTAATIAAALLIAAALPYALVERRWRWRWREVERDRVPAVAGGGAYRDAGVVPRYRARAPLSLRAAGLTSLLLGQLFVPGVVAGTIGVAFGGLGVLTIPWLIGLAKLYRAGLSLLRRDPRLAYFRARDAAMWSLWLNGALVGGPFVLVPLLRPSAAGFPTLPLVCLEGYCLVSLLQALLVRRAIRVHEDALFAASAQPTIEPRAVL
jgi:hypothetical protein